MESWWRQHFPKGRQTLTIADANGYPVTISYGEVGTGQPLVLLHGISNWSYNWRHNIQPLSKHFRVICVDAKGHGFSETTPLPEVAGHQVIELVRIIEILSDVPVLIAAESLGALTALALAQSHAGLVDRLIVMNVPIFPRQLPSWSMRLLSYLPLEVVQWADQQRLIGLATPLIHQVTRWVREEVMTDPSQTTDEEIYGLTYPYLYLPGRLTQLVADLQLAAREIDRLHRQEPNLIGSIQQNLPNITCPTLVLWSDCDRWFPLDNGERLHAQLPNAQFQVIPNCGHVASSGNPTVVNQAIITHCLDDRYLDAEPSTLGIGF